MIKAPICLALLAACGGCVPPSGPDMPRLERDILLAANRESPGLGVSVWLAQADGRELLAIDADRPIPGASTLKILLLVEAYARQIDGSFRWTDEHTLLDSDKVGGSGSFHTEPSGSSWTYYQYARRMISESDNTSANIFLRRLGMEHVNERARTLGLTVTRFEREYMDFDAYREGRDNWTTAREMGTLARRILRREILTPDACDEIIRLLEHTSRGRIAAGVPREIAVGHKSGAFPGLQHDVGWVRLPGNPYVLSVFLDRLGAEDEARGRAALEAVGRIVFEELGPTEE